MWHLILKPQGMYFTRFLKNVYLAFFNRTFEKKKKKEMICNFYFLGGWFACPASLNQMIRSYMKSI